jgi:Cu+-exporting ATPase
VPADAKIIEGTAALSEALLTGESAPIAKAVGDTIFAGTVVTDDALVCRVIRPLQEARLAQVMRLVQETLSVKPPIQRLADRVSTYFALGIVGLAILALIGWLLAGHPLAQALLAAVAVLVVACPCSLGLATPLALAVTLGRASRAGILIRNPAALETVARTRRVAFDKTGTLTQGLLSVADVAVESSAGKTTEEMLRLAAGVEQYSEHPVAKAIVEACPGPVPQAQNFQAARGLGATARVPEMQAEQAKVGSARFLGVKDASPLAVAAEARADQGETVVWVGWDQAIVGWIALRDEPNATARAALEQLSARGIRAVILSGDSPQTTKAIAGELGLQEYAGGMSPADKAQRIRQWQSAGEQTTMVGDGVNDAPALAQADLSVTTAGGTDVAGETSDVVLTHADLTLVPWLIDLSRHTRRIIVENLGWAFAYNVVAVPLAALGLIRPAIAALTMAASSLLVVGNSLRLRRLARHRR